MSKRNAPLPVSLADNCYDLLGDVITAIKKEPRRVHMGNWVRRGRYLEKFLRGREPFSIRPKVLKRPACGTVACIGGWSLVMAGKRIKDDTFHDTFRQVVKLFGGQETAFWFAPVTAFIGDFNHDISSLLLKGYPSDTQYGTRAYADQVIKRIRTFRRMHRNRLIKTPITRLKAKVSK